MRSALRRCHSSGAVVLALGLLLLAISACATSGGSSGPRRDANLITAEELTEYGTFTARDVIRRLRPRWLQSRGAGTGGPQTPQVILDGSRLGGLDRLNSIQVSDVTEMRYLSASDATMRFGTNFPGGAIEITTRAR